MVKKSILFITGALLMGLLSGCNQDLDLDNLDTRIQLGMGVALPVGNMRFSVNDFLGGGQIKQIYADEDGVFHFNDTIDIPTKEYHRVDLSKYIGQTDKAFKVYDELNRMGYVDKDGIITLTGTPISLNFPLGIKLAGLNKQLSDERIDSVQVLNANFTSVVNTTALGLEWSWINYVDVILGDEFSRKSGNTVRLYTKGDGYNYGTNIPVSIDAFTACFMQDKHSDPGINNVTDSCHFKFVFNFTIPSGKTVQLQKASAFDYHFEVQMVDYQAIWGFFEASSDMRDHNTYCIDSLWDEWKNIKKMKVRIMEPQVEVFASHHVAAPLYMYLDTLIVANATEHVSATWNGNTYYHFPLMNFLNPASPLTDSVYNSQLFNHEEANGHIDKLFDIRPDTLRYSFRMAVDKNDRRDYPWKQHRITNDTRVRAYAVVDVPFKVNTESEAQYLTKIEDVHIDRFSLDSILKDVKVIEKSQAKQIKLFLLVENGLPFDFDATAWFYDKDSVLMNLHLFDDQEDNRLHLTAPKMVRDPGNKYGRITEPSQNMFIVDVDENQFDELTRCSYMKLDAFMGKNPQPCVIDTNSYITLHLGVAANVEAIMNFKNQDK